MNPYFFWVLVLGLLGVFSIPFLLLFIVGVWKRSRLLKWIGGVPVAGFLTLVAVVLCLFIIGIVHPCSDTTSGTKISSSFVDTFGFQPGSDFVPLNQRIFSVADCGGMYLQFKATPATFEKIRAMNFGPIDEWQFFEYTGGPYAPTWWIRTNQISGTCYHNSTWKGPYGGNRAYIYYEPDSGVIYFLTSGSD